MDKQAEALEQWLDRIRPSDVAVRSQAASDLGMVLEKYVGQAPGMPPDCKGWIPDDLRLRRPTENEITHIVRVLRQTILTLVGRSKGSEPTFGERRPPLGRPGVARSYFTVPPGAGLGSYL